MLAIQLVKDIKMPANWGEMSKWFTLNPELVPPFKPTPIVSRVTVNHLSQPVNAATNSATAGPNCPETINQFKDLLWVKIQKNIERILRNFIVEQPLLSKTVKLYNPVPIYSMGHFFLWTNKKIILLQGLFVPDSVNRCGKTKTGYRKTV